MEPTMQQNVDLIDDIWIRIFTSLDCRLRARLFRVCKRWQSTLSNPLCWLRLDVKLLDEPTTGSADDSFSRFASKYCTLTSKVNIEVAFANDWEGIFQALFSLTQLRYLRFTVAYSWGNALPLLKGSAKWNTGFTTPNWSNLVYLNFSCTSFHHETASAELFESSVFARILQGAPNLEELYLHRYLMTEEGLARILEPLQKLKRLSVAEEMIRTKKFSFGQPTTNIPELVISHVPRLQTLFLYRNETPSKGTFSFGFGQQPATPICQQYGNTLVVSSNLLHLSDLATVKQIGPALKLTNYAQYFVSRELDLELLDYLFNELKLDVNCNTLDDASNPFTADLFVLPLSFNAVPNCPLSSVIENVELVRKILDLGADPNMAHENMSSFAQYMITKESCLLLLERGADPLKPVNGRTAVAHLFDSENITDEDMAEIMQAMLAKGLNANLVVELGGETTLLDVAIEHRYLQTALLLVAQGAKWSADALDCLVTWNHHWWKDVIESGVFDVNKLYLSTVLRAVKHSLPDQRGPIGDAISEFKQNLFPLVRGYLEHQPKDLDANGYSLVHYICGLPLSSTPVKKASKKASPPPKRKNVGSAKVDAPAKSAFSFGSSAKAESDFSFGSPKAAPSKVSFSFSSSSTSVAKTSSSRKSPDSPRKATVGVKENNRSTTDERPMSANSISLEQLIKELNLDVNAKSTKGQTPLLLVCEDPTDDATTVTALLKCGAHVNEPDLNGWTPLHAALYLHKYDTVQVLLSHGANINAQDKLGITPVAGFVLSIRWPSEDDQNMWTHLLSLDVDVTITDKYMSRSLLHYVCISTHDELLQLLLQKLPDLNVNCRDAHGFTPLHYAAFGLQEYMMQSLVEHGADTNAVSHTLKLTAMTVMLAALTPTSPYHRYIKSYNTLSCESPSAPSTLALGPAKNQLEIIETRIPSWLTNDTAHTKSKKASNDPSYCPVPTDLSVKDQFGNNCLHALVWSVDYVKQFLDKSDMFPSALNDLWSVPNKFGTTPFHIYAKRTYFSPTFRIEEADEYLLKILAMPQIVDSLANEDEHGKTGLEYLMQHKDHRPPLSGCIKSALYQIRGLKFASPTVESVSSLLHTAIEHDALDAVMLGKIAESDPSSLNEKVNGQTPLMHYIEKLFTRTVYPHMPVPTEWVKIIDAFLALKVDLNAQDNHGNTALHYACFFFHLGGWDRQSMHDAHLFSFILFKLLDAGARVDVKNHSDQSAVDIIPNLLELDRSLVHLVKIEHEDNYKKQKSRSPKKKAKSAKSSYKF